jgi:hypothetical protein
LRVPGGVPQVRPGRRSDGCVQGIESIFELLPGNEFGFQIARKALDGLARQVRGIVDAGKQVEGRDRDSDPFPAGVRDRDQVTGEVAAIHG